jgi:galactokinase
VRAPGRINLIGEHTDYNGGVVFPLAIDRTVLIAARPAIRPGYTNRVENIIRVYSVDFEREGIFEAAHLVHNNDLGWLNYIQGTLWALEQNSILTAKEIPALDIAITGNVPHGAGLSSSAALEVASGLLFQLLAGIELDKIDKKQLALTCQHAENKFVGANTGIMDQAISALGQKDAALLINTNTLDYRAIPLGFDKLGLKVVAVDSAVPHTHATGGYNERRAEAEEALRLLQPLLNLPATTKLCDITPAQFATVEANLPEVNRKRARHAITENARVWQAITYLENGLDNPATLKAFGELINQSHFSLRDDYEVSASQVDLLVDLAQNTKGVIGARITGGGFGGCSVNIVEASALDVFKEQVFEAYRSKTGLDAKMYICQAVEGVSVVYKD